MRATLILPLIVALAAGCSDSAEPISTGESPESLIQFEDVTEAAGIDFKHFDSIRASLLPEDMGSGAAWGDIDGDGLEDLYVANFAGPLLASTDSIRKRPGGRLYRNQGRGHFEDITAAAGLIRSAHDAGALLADLDNDGDPDLIITGLGGCCAYRNDAGRFTEITAESGLNAVKGMALGAALADYDLDGDLDLYVPCYVHFPTEEARTRRKVGGRPEPWTTPASYPPQSNFLMRNDGALRFSDVTAEAGVGNPRGRSLQVVFTDFDGDRRPDIFVGNDQSVDALFQNLGDGTFKDRSIGSGLWDPRASMGIGVGDLDGDGDLDLHLTHFVQEPPALMMNKSTPSETGAPGRILFRDFADKSGMLQAWSRGLVGWATALQDFDNDGDIDLIAFHGSTIEDELTQEVFTNPKLLPQRPMVLANDGNAQLSDVRSGAGPFFREETVVRGGAFADFDKDGRVDVFLNVHNGKGRLLRNTSKESNWLRVRLIGTTSNRDGIGAVLKLRLQDGRTLMRQVVCGSSYLAGDSLVQCFGLGNAKIENLSVTWPSTGKTQQIKRPEPNQTLYVKESQ